MQLKRNITTLALAGLGWIAPLTSSAQTTFLNPPFGSSTSQQEPVLIIATVIQVLLGFIGAATLLVFIWGGFNLIFSGGEAEKINKARSTLLWAVIGLAIILSSYALLSYTFSVFKIASGGT
jgi:hypothetical protein